MRLLSILYCKTANKFRECITKRGFLEKDEEDFIEMIYEEWN